MHQPFPSSEIFRCLTYREELLRGMLCADHIGFHLFEWARNFLTSCRRLLSCTYEIRRGGGLTVHYQGREVAITCSHMGVEPQLLSQLHRSAFGAPDLSASARSLPVTSGPASENDGSSDAEESTEVDNEPRSKAAVHPPPPQQEQLSIVQRGVYRSVVSGSVSADDKPFTLDAAALRSEHAGFTCFGSIDVLEGLKGVPLKLLAFEHLLHASKREVMAKLRLLLIGMIPDARPHDHLRIKEEVLEIIERINLAFPRAVHFRECRSFDIASRLALWSVTDVFVVTSVREGLNLLPVEYILAREQTPGVLVLSEFCSLRASCRARSHAILGVYGRCRPRCSVHWSCRRICAVLALPPTCVGASPTQRAFGLRVLADVAAASRRKIEGGSADGERGGTSCGLGLGLGWRPPARLGLGLAEGVASPDYERTSCWPITGRHRDGCSCSTTWAPSSRRRTSTSPKGSCTPMTAGPSARDRAPLLPSQRTKITAVAAA